MFRLETYKTNLDIIHDQFLHSSTYIRQLLILYTTMGHFVYQIAFLIILGSRKGKCHYENASTPMQYTYMYFTAVTMKFEKESFYCVLFCFDCCCFVIVLKHRLWVLIRLVSIKLIPHCALVATERSGSVVECLTRDRRAAGSSLTGVTALWSLSRTHLS